MHVDDVLYSSKQDLEDILRFFNLDVRIIGEVYKEKNYTVRAYCEEKGNRDLLQFKRSPVLFEWT